MHVVVDKLGQVGMILGNGCACRHPWRCPKKLQAAGDGLGQRLDPAEAIIVRPAAGGHVP